MLILLDYTARSIAVKSSITLIIDGEIAVPVYNCYIAIESDGTDLPVDLMTTIQYQLIVDCIIVLCMRSVKVLLYLYENLAPNLVMLHVNDIRLPFQEPLIIVFM